MLVLPSFMTCRCADSRENWTSVITWIDSMSMNPLIKSHAPLAQRHIELGY